MCANDTCICMYFLYNSIVSLHNMHVLVNILVDVTKYLTKNNLKDWFILAYSSIMVWRHTAGHVVVKVIKQSSMNDGTQFVFFFLIF